MSKSLLCCLFILLFLPSNSLLGQETDFDSELWMGIDLKKKIGDDWQVYASQNLRLNDNLHRYKNSFTELGVSYRIHKYLKLGTYYRYVMLPQPSINTHRVAAKASTKVKVSNFALAYRFGYQYDFDRQEGEHHIRNKLTLSYSKKKLFVSPSLGAELFQMFNYEIKAIDQLRLFAALDFELGKTQEIQVKYIFRKKYNDRGNPSGQVFSVGYAFIID